jgi:serine/threonine protein kinase
VSIVERYDGGKWEEAELIGKGAFSAVYKIRKVESGQESVAALKVMPIPHSDDALRELRAECVDEEAVLEAIEEMTLDRLNEVKMKVDLMGPENITYFEDFRILGKEDGIGNYMLMRMELLESLENFMESGLEEEECLKIGKDICNALEWLESRSAIHKAIKPENILMAGTGAYKLDFGIAAQMGGTETSDFMAPEIFSKQQYGSLVDIYSLGMVLYRLLNQGRAPFYPLPPRAATENRLKKGEGLPYPSNASPKLGEIILKACAFNKEDRYQTAGEFREALESCERSGAFKARPAAAPRKKPAAAGNEVDRLGMGNKMSGKGIYSGNLGSYTGAALGAARSGMPEFEGNIGVALAILSVIAFVAIILMIAIFVQA